MNHGIILGCLQADGCSQGELVPDRACPDINLKRSGGAHKIATFLRKNDWDIEVLDYWLAFTTDEFKQFIHSRVTADTKFIGASVTFGYRGKYLKRAQDHLTWVKEAYPDVMIIGGSKSLIDTMNLPCDYYVAGYGEFGLYHLLNGTAVISDFMGKKYVNADKDHPCFPQKDLVVRYEDRDFIQPTDNLTLELSRGCKFKCKFCSYNAIGLKGDIDRDMESLYTELKENYEKWGVTSYHCADETVNDKTEKLKKAAEAIKKLPFKPNLTGFTRADLLISREDDKHYMAEMGFWAHYYGIETYNQKAGSVIGKGMNRDKMKQGLLDIRDYFWKEVGRYRSSTSVIVGLPYETRESFFEGLDWHKENFFTESILFFPLFLNKFHKHLEMNGVASSSEFDRTWEEGNDFHDHTITDEEVGANPEAFPEGGLRQYLWGNYKQNSALPWSHDTFNWWTAHLALRDVYTGGYMVNRGIMNWELFNFTAPGTYTWDEVLQLNIDNYDVKKLKEDHDLFIQNYKNAKLNI